MAIQAIHDGDCDGAIVATSNWIMDPMFQIAMDKLGALSSASMSHAFDASADGYARGEGFAALYLKRPEAAMQDGNPIRALVRGSAIGANGRSTGITHPSGDAQEDIIRKAYDNAGLLPSNTPFLECHGTGTRVGDPLEVTAAGNVFGLGRSENDPLLLGSVKTVLGHTEGAAALAGIFKAILALEAGQIPPSHGVDTLNPRIDFVKAKAQVVTELVPWPKGKPRRASITSAGFGGSIGHCILDHVNEVYPDYVKPETGRAIGSTPSCNLESNGAPRSNGTNSTNGTNGSAYTNGAANCIEHGHQIGPSSANHLPVLCPPRKISRSDASSRQFVLLPFSAHNTSSLQANINALSNVITQHSLADTVYTLAARRSKLAERAFYVVNRDSIAKELLDDTPKATSTLLDPSHLGFIFTGQGAQWHAMGAALFEYHIFRSAIEHVDYVLTILSRPPQWTIADILCGRCDADSVNSPEISQTVCTALQIGLVDLLASWGVYPSGVVGHSSGEIAAAYAAGRINAAEAIATAYFRGQTVAHNEQKGAMLAVGLGLEQVEQYLVGFEHSVTVAAINSPGSVTLSGELEAVKKMSEILNQESVFNRLLKTGGNAYHSVHMVALGARYDEMLSDGLAHLERLGLRDKSHRYPRIAWASSVTFDKKGFTETSPATYWRANLESPVRFSDAVTNMLKCKDADIGLLIEIGPHPALKSPLSQILKSLGKAVPYAESLKRGEDARASMLGLAGSLFSLNAQIDLTAVNATDEVSGDTWVLAHGVTAVDLPPYQYVYGPVNYYESRSSKEFRLRRVLRHDLLGSKIAGNAKLRPQFRNVLRSKDIPWLTDHRLIPDAVFPAAGYLAMAMTAASQIYEECTDAHHIEGYSLRNVDIKTALKIPEDHHGVEVMLSMELVDSATAKAPAWSTFSISSTVRDTNSWTEHCTGMVKLEVSTKPFELDKLGTTTELRHINARAWYKKFADVGLGYGPTFQGLSDIRADPDKSLASAKLNLNTTAGIVKGGESAYTLHPASLDATIQLGLLACHGGQIERMTTAFVPIHLSQMTVRATGHQTWGFAAAHGTLRGLRSAYLQLQLQSQTGDVLLDIKDLRCVRYSIEGQPSTNSHNKAFASPFTRMVYKPDYRALSNRQARLVFPPSEENLAQIPILEKLGKMATQIAVDVCELFVHKDNGVSNLSETTRYYLQSLRRLAESQPDRITELPTTPLDDCPEDLQQLFRDTSHLVESKAMQRLHECMTEIAQNRTTGEEVLSKGGLLAEFFTNSLFVTGAQSQVIRLLDSISHADPHLRILELRGGRAHTARPVLESLTSVNGMKRYREYTVTDTSEHAIKPAREVLAAYRDVHFSILDIEQDPMPQGYQPVYDVVLASQVVHAASSIKRTLKNAQKLLRPGGKLVLLEVTANSAWLSLIGGAQAGFWCGVSEGRIDSPFLSVANWDKTLRSTGFSGVDISLDDYPPPLTHSSVLMSTFVGPQRQAAGPQVIWLLHNAHGSPALLEYLAQELEHRDLLVKTGSLEDSLEELPSDSRVIFFLDGQNLLLDVDQRRFDQFKRLAHQVTSMMWLTSTGMARGRSPDGAVACGLLRIISTEVPAGHFVSIDIDADSFNITTQDEQKELLRVIIDQEQALQEPNNSERNRDGELAWHSGCLWVNRVVPEPALQGYTERLITPVNHGAKLLPLDTQGPVRADFETPGILSSLYFRPYTELLQQPLPDDWIEVKVTAAGLNWKDVALCTGRFDANNLSSEYAGIVTGVGAGAVNRFAAGDAVYGLGKGHFGSHVRAPAAFAQKACPGDDLVDLATMPIVLMTVVYAFEHVVHLRKGQNVLIQSASGGLGLGAIQLARAKGADVFAIAGTQDKVRFLVEDVGLPPSHVVMGRDPSALSRLAAATSNDGFDVILSTASGEMLHETAKALAPLGHLIDVGRLDVMDARSIGLDLFQKGASLSSFDLYLVVDRDPDLGQRLMQAVDDHYRAGHLAPIHPVTVSDVSQLDQTLLRLSRGTHLGKLVVHFAADSRVRMVSAPPAASFDPGACYIITGGLEGLGRSIVQWMGQRGARNIIVLSRRGDSVLEAQTLIDRMARYGVRVQAISCDLSDRVQVTRAIEQAAATQVVKGVVHCAVLYKDISFEKLSLESWREGLAAKVAGTRNLHEATKALALDFFVMTTSFPAVFGFATQAAYTAANNFQDQFARYRRRLSLPATAAQFGLINDIGHLSTDSTAVDMMSRNKALTVTEESFLRLLEPAFISPKNSTPTGAAEDDLAMATYTTCIDPALMAARERDDIELGFPTSAPPRWQRDPRVSHMMQALDDALRHASIVDKVAEPSTQSDGRSAVARLRRDFDEAVQRMRLASAAAEQQEQQARAVELVTAALKTTVAAMLLMDESTVSASRSVSAHGVDSLIATEFRNWLHLALGSKVSMVDLLDPRMTIGMLAVSIVNTAMDVQT